MAFIRTTPEREVEGTAREMLERQRRRYGYLPNYAELFTDRPEILNLWADLLSGIRRHIAPRRFELVTFAAARSLGNAYCSLAHGQVLRDKHLSEAELRALARGDWSHFPDDEVAMMQLAQKLVRDSSQVAQADIDRLRELGLRDPEIFDVVATAAARAFFAKLIEALGAQPDPHLLRSDPELREQLCTPSGDDTNRQGPALWRGKESQPCPS